LKLTLQKIKSDTVHLHSSCWKSSYAWSDGSFSFDTLQYTIYQTDYASPMINCKTDKSECIFANI